MKRQQQTHAADDAAGRRVSTASRSGPIRIDIDPTVTGGYIHDRYDLLLRGRAVSSAPIEEVAVRLDDAVVGRLQFGSEDALEADGDGGFQHIFHINVPLRRADARRTCRCIIAARRLNGEVHEQSFELSVDPSRAAPVSVASGPTFSFFGYAHLRPPVVLYGERAALDANGQLLVHGWAVSQSAMVTVQVFVDDERIGAARLGGLRDDVGVAFPAYPNAGVSGFTLSKRIDEVSSKTVRTVRVQAISLNGFVHEAIVPVERVHVLSGHTVEAAAEPAATHSWSPALQQPTYQIAASFRVGPDLAASLSGTLPPPGSDPRREIQHFCDELALDADGTLRAVGWAVCDVGIASIAILLDGKEMGEADLGLPRDDVGNAFPQISMARFAGFRFAVPLGDIAPGEHSIGVVLRNGFDDIEEEVRSVQVDRAPPPMVPTEFRLEIDKPSVVAGTAVEPVTGRLTIEGWALARSGIDGIEVLLDDQRLGDAHYGLARQDVGTAFPEWTDSLRSGYAFHCPPRSLRNGHHVVQLKIHARNGEILEQSFNIQVHKSEDAEEGMTIRRRMTQVEADVAEDVLAGLGHRPSFRLIMRQDAELDIEALLATIASLRAQVYRDWRLEILANDAAASIAVHTLIGEKAEDLADRIKVIDVLHEAALDAPIGDVAWSTAACLVGLVSAGDQLGCDALLRIALAGGLHRDADMLYADEVRISPVSREREPFFKPDFSPDLLLSTNYIGRPWFASSALFARIGLTTRALLQAGEYDAVLRCAEQAVHIHHVPGLLCLRGPNQLDDAETEATALMRAAARRAISAEVLAGAAPGTWRLHRTAPVSGMVSIIMPTCAARGIIKTCITSLREKTAYRNFEIVCVDNIPDDQASWKLWLQRNADRVVPIKDAFNWSHFNNRGVAAASGEYLLFLNDDIEVIEPDWLDALLEHVQRPEVAVVGPQLLYPDRKVQHAGMFLAAPGTARHAFRFAPADDPGYFGLALTQRNVIAVTGACMLMRRSMFEALGGFDEAHEIINNDLDFCLRVHRAGKLVVFTPYASLIHHEAASRDRLKDVFDLSHFGARWNVLFSAGDPYFSPRLSRQSDDYRPDDETVETIYAGHPLFRHAEIQRILVVKVDHIGDFVTALPAIRRLKAIFPAAAIHVLAGRAARAFAEMEDCIDEFIEFEFFHPVSGLGQKEISPAEYRALRERLTPYRFDIAVDLRKHLDTRDVLRYTPARFLAGFDYMGQFQFLDISLEWEGDRHLHRKRSHVTDDLINLVEAIGTAGAAERTRLAPAAFATEPPSFLPDDAIALFDRPVVAIHPGVGNAMRQWPVEHFASLVDLLVEKNAVNAVLIGGPEEAELAGSVLNQITNRARVVSLVGKTSLRQLPALLRACALYIGNNSGPKHIAAALGVPTIGIHSGVVDAIEWGPIGERAVALRRNMACSPCYLARHEDCPRGFGCMQGLAPAAVQEVAEILLARPIERRLVEPVVEARPVAVTPAKAPAAKRRRNRRRQMASVPAEIASVPAE